jgi:hypothetical protein
MDGGGGIVAAPSGTVTFLFTDIVGFDAVVGFVS